MYHNMTSSSAVADCDINGPLTQAKPGIWSWDAELDSNKQW